MYICMELCMVVKYGLCSNLSGAFVVNGGKHAIHTCKFLRGKGLATFADQTLLLFWGRCFGFMCQTEKRENVRMDITGM